MNDKLNILWICTDSQRWDTLGCYGNKFVNTPNIDKLASEGVLFENAFVQNPLCTPSRGSFLTGRYPVTNGLTKNGQNINPDEKLITKALADNGYTCGLSGKLHINACDNRIKNYGLDWWKEVGKVDFDMREPRIDDGYSVFNWGHAPTGNPHSDYTKWAKERGIDKFRLDDRSDCKWVKKGLPKELHQTTWCAEKASEFINDNNKNPWLFSVNCFDPHYPFDPPEELLKPYLDKLDKIPLPDFVKGEMDNKPESQQRQVNSKGYNTAEMTNKDHKMIRAAYWAMCDLIDIQVGKIIQTLEETEQRENTVIIFTSDHGELLGDHSCYIKGPLLYDASIHVPLIISCPGIIEQNKRSKALVEAGDLASTILDACKEKHIPGMQAKSLWNLLRGKENLNNFRDDVYCEYYDSNPDNPIQNMTMIRNHYYKLIAHHGADTISELYDLKNDPCESRNLWNNEKYKEIQSKMYMQLCKKMALTADTKQQRLGIY